jgi:hypothetical protein
MAKFGPNDVLLQLLKENKLSRVVAPAVASLAAPGPTAVLPASGPAIGAAPLSVRHTRSRALE